MWHESLESCSIVQNTLEVVLNISCTCICMRKKVIEESEHQYVILLKDLFTKIHDCVLALWRQITAEGQRDLLCGRIQFSSFPNAFFLCFLNKLLKIAFSQIFRFLLAMKLSHKSPLFYCPHPAAPCVWVCVSTPVSWNTYCTSGDGTRCL